MYELYNINSNKKTIYSIPLIYLEEISEVLCKKFEGIF